MRFNPLLLSGAPSEYILIIVLGAIMALFVVMSFLRQSLKMHSYRRQTRDLERRFETACSILTGQNSQSIRRLEIISQSNLLYTDIHQNFLQRYQDIKDGQSPKAKAAIENMQNILASKKPQKYRTIKATLKLNKEVVVIFVEQIDLFTKELKEVLNVEEQCRNKALQQKEKLRKLKNQYFEHESELRLVQKSFETLFDNIDEAFSQFEECVDRATYEEVESILSNVRDVLNELELVIDDMPVLCAMIENVAPSKLKNLRIEFARMNENDYPVHHLRVVNGMEEMQAELEDITRRLLTLSVDGCRIQLDKMFDRIENIIGAFEEEKSAKVVFGEKCEEVYHEVNRIERDFIKLCNLIPDVKRKYQIEPEFENKIVLIRNDISTMTLIKRTLDNYIHSSTHQPFSLLVEKMTALENEALKINKAMNMFDDHLKSLESDCEYAQEYIHKAFFTLKTLEYKVRETACISFEIKWLNDFKQCYEFMDSIDAVLKKAPINVMEVNTNIDGLTILHDELNKKVEDATNFCIAGENLIVFANRSRHRLSDVKSLLNQIEISFFDGEFERVYIEAGNVVKKIQGKI